MNNLSDKQEAMLAFIETFVDQNGFPPTHEEIRQGLNISTKSLVNYHLEALEDAAFLIRVPNTPRGIRLKSEGSSTVKALELEATNLPVLESDEIVELTYDIVTNDSNLYALRVEEASLEDDFVRAGDIVILQRQPRVNNGEMAAIRLRKEGQTTFKRYYRENGHVKLQPATENQAALILRPEAIEVQGKILAVIRQGNTQKMQQSYAIG
jgi:repressor LexA